MLSDEVKELERDYRIATQKIAQLTAENIHLKELVEKYKKLCEMVIPNKVYTHKERRNTTVKFLDGSQVTFKRRGKEKDCIETAIAYCILKQLMPAEDLRKLINDREEH